MSLSPPQGYRKTEHIHRIGFAADRPNPQDVLIGTLYYSTDTEVLERSNGIVWEPYVGTGAVPTAGDIIVREIPTGQIDGNNTTFTLANTPISNSEQIFLNGLLQDTRGIDYSISGAVITFLIPPLSGDRILVTYQKV